MQRKTNTTIKILSFKFQENNPGAFRNINQDTYEFNLIHTQTLHPLHCKSPNVS